MSPQLLQGKPKITSGNLLELATLRRQNFEGLTASTQSLAVVAKAMAVPDNL